MKYLLTIIILVIIAIIGFVLIKSSDNVATNNSNSAIEKDSNAATYENIDSEELAEILSTEEDTFLLDVHIPEQSHIEGTDSFIPYNELDSNIDKLPSDKNQKIVVYCRSGSMSKVASDKLLDLGYTDVSNLEGGINSWNQYQKNK